jgi:hypothetical protein
MVKATWFRSYAPNEPAHAEIAELARLVGGVSALFTRSNVRAADARRRVAGAGRSVRVPLSRAWRSRRNLQRCSPKHPAKLPTLVVGTKLITPPVEPDFEIASSLRSSQRQSFWRVIASEAKRSRPLQGGTKCQVRTTSAAGGLGRRIHPQQHPASGSVGEGRAATETTVRRSPRPRRKSR